MTDVCGQLPTGTTVLEASAGTGKTWTIAALATRYVAEGHATLPELMLVTFGREATRELRERVRERLVAVATGLAAPERARRASDPVLALLATIDDEEVARRRGRLVQALAHFDAATIATTHQFCQEMLAGLGIAGDADPDATFVEQIDDVITEVVDDFYVRAYARPGAGEPLFDRKTALAIGRAVVNDPEARIEPAPGGAPGTPAAVRADFARAVRVEVERRKRTRRLYTYDDMLTRLHRALTHGRVGDAACRRLRARYRVVLVDEFQDTDRLQWGILRVAFHGHVTLTFVGDPKQAIYAFRGADVASYLDAVRVADTADTLDVNWRSDAALLAALNTVFGGAALGDPRIVVRPVRSAHPGRRLTGAPVGAALRLRVVRREGLRRGWGGMPRVELVRERAAADAAADVATLLAADSRWEGGSLLPRHVAVLVRTNQQAEMIRDALAAATVPAVLGGTSSVFATESAEEWLTLLRAVEQPGRAARVRGAALTCFLGRRSAELDADPDTVLAEVGELLRRWVGVLRERGVAAFLEAIAARTGLAERMLAVVGGERRLTDVRHVGQVLHAEAAPARLGAGALADWLRLRIAEARDRPTESRPERSRRLESDADAVQVMTVHKGKGLEFPVVYVPFGWDRTVYDRPEVTLHHDATGTRVRAVGGASDPEWEHHVGEHRREEEGEDLRLLYVALTRAQGQVVAWWAPSTNTASSAVHRLLVGRPAPGTDPRPHYPVPDDDVVWEQLGALAGPDVAVERVERRSVPTFVPDAGPAPTLAAARFDRALDLAWRRSSYSSLTAAAHQAPTSEPEEDTVADEGDLELAPDAAAETSADLVAVPSPMADLPVGTAFGTLVHAVLETVDTGAADLTVALSASVAEQLARRPVAGVEVADLASALVAVMETPLAPGWRLRDVAPRDRLAELEFELPLAGGDAPSAATVTLGQAAALLRRHLAADDPLRAYPDALDGLSAQVLRGYLTGSIDAVLRAPDGRFVVVDYKSNWLGPTGPGGPEPLTAAHYGPAPLATAMVRAHYPLQALLYAVALHRFLRWRLPGYDPAEHLGGVLYLFLRGMCGPRTPVVDGTTCGVFTWSPPAAAIVELSQLLDGGAR